MINKKLFLISFVFLLFFPLVSAELPDLINGNQNLPELKDSNTLIGNFTFSSKCINGGAEIRSDGTICGQRLEVFNVTSVNITFQNVTVEEDFIVEGDFTLGQKITFSFGEIIDNIVNGWIRITGGLNVTGETNLNGNVSIVGNLSVEGNTTSNEFFGDIEADFVKIALGSGSPTIDQMQEYLDNTGSSGFFEGGDLTDGGAGTVDIASGSGFIRTTTDENSELQSFKWSASSGVAVTDNTTQYVYVDDSGVISLSTNEFLEASDLIKIGVVTDEGGVIESTFKLGVRLEESIAEAGRFIRRVEGISRDVRRGGLIFGESGDANRDVTVTTGSLWWGRTEYIISALDTSGADTFFTYSASGQENATASQYPNEQYDNAGTLTTMTNNRWANLFFYIEPDDHVLMVYGREQFVTQAQAENEGVPSTSLPSRLTEASVLAARFTFQKSANTAEILSAFGTTFSSAGVTDHGNLAGLSDDDHTQYLLADGSRSLSANWDQGAFNFTNVQSWFLGLVDWNSLRNILPQNSTAWNRSGTDVFLANTGDSVGIGTSTPDSVFHIKANIAGNVGSHPAGQLIIQNPADSVTSNAVITAYESDGSGNPDQQLWYLGSSSSSNSNIILLNRRNALLQFGTNDNTQMTILGNGDVGIGTTSPQNKLNVVGDGNFTGTVYALGQNLSESSFTETDPFWSANYSTFLTHATTTYVDTQNTSQTNYINFNNISVTNAIADVSVGGGIWTNVSGNATYVGGVNITDTLMLLPQLSPNINTEGGIFYNSSTKTLMTYNGTDWQGLSGVPQGSIIQFENSCPTGYSEVAESVVSEKERADAWVNFNGNTCSGTCTIRDSFNVVNVTRNGAGDYTIFWDRDFANANYTIVGTTAGDTSDTAVRSLLIDNTNPFTVGAARILTRRGSVHNSAQDAAQIEEPFNNIMAFGNTSSTLKYCEKVGQDSQESNSFWGNTGTDLFVNNITWNVGIGLTSPTKVLDVLGDILFTGFLNVVGKIQAVNLTLTGDPSGTPDANTLYAKSLPKSWVNFDGVTCSGTGGSCGTATCTIRDSFNVECVDRLATGQFKIYWDRDFANINYVVTATTSTNTGRSGTREINIDENNPPVVGSARLLTSFVTSSVDRTSVDDPYNMVIAFGEQA